MIIGVYEVGREKFEYHGELRVRYREEYRDQDG